MFLHYWGGSSRTWKPVLDLLADRAVLTIDSRGWGRSRTLAGPYTLQQLADDVRVVIADAGITDFVLIGHSMGGKVAQLVAAAQPAGLRGLVLVGSGPAKPPAQLTPAYQQQLAHAYDSGESVIFARDNILTATELPATLKEQIVSDSLASAPDARTEWPLRGIGQDITEQARQITVPLLVIAGENDQVEPVEVQRALLADYLHEAQFHVIPATGHLMPLEAADDLAAALTDFGPIAESTLL